MYIFSIGIPFYGDLIYAKKIKKAGKGLVVPLLDALRRGEEQLEPPFALVQAFKSLMKKTAMSELRPAIPPNCS